MMRGAEHDQREPYCFNRSDDKLRPGEARGGNQADYDTQQNHAKNVIEDSCAKNDPGRQSLQHVHVSEHTRRDSDAGGDHGCCHKGGFMGRAANQHHVAETQDKRHSNSRQSDIERGSPDLQKFLGVSFKVQR